MPESHLPPSVPLRLNYIEWIHKLLEEKQEQKNSAIRGIDIGTGASCIYPLLGRKLHNWEFLATEVNEDSIQSAQENIAMNKFENEIEIRFVDCARRRKILVEVIEDNEEFDFCMCNPPFFESEEETGLISHRECDASSSEMITDGGELSFVTQIVDESKVIGKRIRIYSSMVGKKATMNQMLKKLAEMKIVNEVHTAQFSQGKLARWAIAWTGEFDDN